MSERNKAYGCLFCRSGSEDRIIRELENSHPSLTCIAPKRVRIRRRGGVGIEELVSLFPGYIFFCTSVIQEFRTLLQKADIYRLLRYPNGDWKLYGSDLYIATLMFEVDGVVGLSKACFEGNTVKILEGPLKDYEGCIIKINKRAKTAQVKVDFQGKVLIMWLGFEIIPS